MCHTQSQWLFASLCIVAFLTTHGDFYSTSIFLEALPIISFADVQPCSITAQKLTRLHILHSTFMREKHMAGRQADIRYFIFLKKASSKGHFRSGLMYYSHSYSTGCN